MRHVALLSLLWLLPGTASAATEKTEKVEKSSPTAASRFALKKLKGLGRTGSVVPVYQRLQKLNAALRDGSMEKQDLLRQLEHGGTGVQIVHLPVVDNQAPAAAERLKLMDYLVGNQPTLVLPGARKLIIDNSTK
jgi:hypothetical protein